MTRSFDVFDRDDFRSPDDLDRGASGGSESFWSARVRLSELHRKEERADAHDREALDRSGRERPPLRREERVREILAQRVRTVFRNRDKTYELTGEREHDRLLTIQQVAAMLHVPVSWVYGRTRTRSTQRLPGIRLGKYWRFREEEIHRWIESQRGGYRAA